MDIETIKSKILVLYPDTYTSENIMPLLAKIEHMDPNLRSDLEHFLSTGDITTKEVEGYTVEMLMKEHSMNEIAAFLTLDWIIREPQKALKSLQKGHERI